MGLVKKDVINALNASVKELQQGIDTHCYLVSSILQGEVDERHLRSLSNFCPKRPQELMYEDAIKEAIEVIEESRKAFKSKRLEMLRKKLTQVLIDAK
jgi:hypothetical protein